jgi:GNAT superfamily N-acetyltransferase
MTAADLAFADSLRALAGWNQTRKDWQRLLAHEPHGCFLAEWDGVPTGTATTTCYGSELAWIGMVLVHPDYRRRGVGTALLQRCLDYLSGRRIRCIKLDATPAGRPVYERLGFQSEWALARWEHACVEQTSAVSTAEFRSWQNSDARLIEAIDRRAFGVSRQSLLQAMAKESLHALAHNSQCGGMLREGARALYLGPVVAASPAAGASLIPALLTHAMGKSVFWDIPEPNTMAVELAKHLKFTRQRPLLRMYRGENEYPGDPQMQFAVADPAIG